MMKEPYKILGISQTISRSNPCFRGGAPFDCSLKGFKSSQAESLLC